MGKTNDELHNAIMAGNKKIDDVGKKVAKHATGNVIAIAGIVLILVIVGGQYVVGG